MLMHNARKKIMLKMISWETNATSGKCDMLAENYVTICWDSQVEHIKLQSSHER